MKALHVLVFSVLAVVLNTASSSAGFMMVLTGSAGSKISVERIAEFNEPWAMTFLPDGRMLVTEKRGTLLLVEKNGRGQTPVTGVPQIAYGGQGGLGDVVLDPRFGDNGLVYISYAEPGQQGTRGAAVAVARLRLDDSPSLAGLRVIWRQIPKVSGSGHYSHRLAFGPDGMLYISSGERQKEDPAQSWTMNLGKIIRLRPDGTVPPDNPFQDRGELARSFWTTGHRNVLGLAFDQQGRLWANEMGPRHGDEFNLILPGENYGWPLVSWGNHYSGFPIADHDTRPEFRLPATYWIPSIAPSGLVFYSGKLFAGWQGNAVMGGLVSQALIRVEVKGAAAEEVERFDMGQRIREVEQGPDDAIWLLEDQPGGGLLRLTPAQ